MTGAAVLLAGVHIGDGHLAGGLTVFGCLVGGWVVRAPIGPRSAEHAAVAKAGGYGPRVRGLRVGFVMFVIDVLRAGCVTVGDTGAPTEPSPAVTAPAAPVEPTGVVLPPRPRDVPVAGVDPCSLLTSEQRMELGLEQKSRSSSAPSVLYEGADVPQCTLQGFTPRAVAVGLFLVTSAGIDFWTSGDLDATLRVSSIRGFPAVVAVPARFSKFCTAIVDVGPGQLVEVQFSDGGLPPPIPQEQLCRDAEQVAAAVMHTVLAR